MFTYTPKPMEVEFNTNTQVYELMLVPEKILLTKQEILDMIDKLERYEDAASEVRFNDR